MTGPRLRKPAPPSARNDVIAAADSKLVAVRDLFASALLAHSRHAPDAALRTREALNAIETARAELARLNDKEEPR
jgi:hypothetical protein